MTERLIWQSAIRRYAKWTGKGINSKGWRLRAESKGQQESNGLEIRAETPSKCSDHREWGWAESRDEWHEESSWRPWSPSYCPVAAVCGILHRPPCAYKWFYAAASCLAENSSQKTALRVQSQWPPKLASIHCSFCSQEANTSATGESKKCWST